MPDVVVDLAERHGPSQLVVHGCVTDLDDRDATCGWVADCETVEPERILGTDRSEGDGNRGAAREVCFAVGPPRRDNVVVSTEPSLDGRDDGSATCVVGRQHDDPGQVHPQNDGGSAIIDRVLPVRGSTAGGSRTAW